MHTDDFLSPGAICIIIYEQRSHRNKQDAILTLHSFIYFKVGVIHKPQWKRRYIEVVLNRPKQLQLDRSMPQGTSQIV